MGAEWWIRRGLRKNLDENARLDGRLSQRSGTNAEEIQGMVKARVSTSSNVSLMWEGRVGQTLLSLGIKSDFSNKSKPIRALGLELAYFGSD